MTYYIREKKFKYILVYTCTLTVQEPKNLQKQVFMQVDGATLRHEDMREVMQPHMVQGQDKPDEGS